MIANVTQKDRFQEQKLQFIRNPNPVLYYNLKNKQDLANYFKLNDAAQRVHSFYQNQDILPNMWVGTVQKELEKTRIENVRLYYYKSFN
ncbi:DUF5838 family protein [Dolichospermum sp. UHCC 0684]|uniref:DUF5838 family protein n=1 Tax=unclassified Dolichospermum TaxID=2622029 RepID=UPI001D13A19A|nr:MULTISPECIES: DUF5838 family protein [unclassified Dolichospermum]MDM3850231.1 DUF5838 family protein [Aphanizomenon gracile PMC627.10]MEA5532005.1 DUF5838 family protein [Dolichospermum sp. UHCC 0684]